jgi:hypothetical protein
MHASTSADRSKPVMHFWCSAVDSVTVQSIWLAWGDMVNSCADSALQSLSMQVHLFGALVAHILRYCSEVCGLPCCAKVERADHRL